MHFVTWWSFDTGIVLQYASDRYTANLFGLLRFCNFFLTRVIIFCFGIEVALSQSTSDYMWGYGEPSADPSWRQVLNGAPRTPGAAIENRFSARNQHLLDVFYSLLTKKLKAKPMAQI